MTILYRGMDRAALDAAYLNTKAVPDFPGLLASCQARSAALYAATPGRRDLRYGAQPAQRFDWLPCGQPDAPLFVFIHGGYWQHCTKRISRMRRAGRSRAATTSCSPNTRSRRLRR